MTVKSEAKRLMAQPPEVDEHLFDESLRAVGQWRRPLELLLPRVVVQMHLNRWNVEVAGTFHFPSKWEHFFKKWAIPASFSFIFVFSYKHYNFYNKYMWKNLHPVYGASAGFELESSDEKSMTLTTPTPTQGLLFLALLHK